MNRKTLNKVIEELKKEKPNLDYIRGILETLVESLPEENLIYKTETATFSPIVASGIMPLNESIKDETASMEASAVAMLKNIDMSQISKE